MVDSEIHYDSEINYVNASMEKIKKQKSRFDEERKDLEISLFHKWRYIHLNFNFLTTNRSNIVKIQILKVF